MRDIPSHDLPRAAVDRPHQELRLPISSFSLSFLRR
jgi:hypothetical protein